MVYSIGFTDADLYSAYTDAQRTVTLAELDAGARGLGYTQTSARSLAASGDQVIASPEVFEALVSRNSLHNVYQRFASEPLPWLAASASASGSATSSLLTEFDTMVADWRRAHPSESRTGEAMARAIYQWVNSPTGFAMVHDPAARELNIEQIATQRRGDCTEYAKLFLLLMSRAGFTTFPVWVQRDLNGAETAHIVAGVEIGGRTVLLDPVYSRFNPAHQATVRMSSREFLGWHWNNRALDVQRTNPAEALRLFNRALLIDPTNPHFLTNRGMLHLRWERSYRDEAASLTGAERRVKLSAASVERTSARSDFNAAVASVPNFHYAQFQLGNMEYDSDRFSSAVTFYRSALTSSPANESYFRNLILALHSAGEAARARRELGRMVALYPGQMDLVRLVGTPIRD